jgi:undecaprenyl diphosphate synthase
MKPILPHVLLMPDGDRRFAREHSVSDKDVYLQAADRVRRFIQIAFSEFQIQTISVFITRPATFEYAIQERTNENLLGILNAVETLALHLAKDYSCGENRPAFRTVGDVSVPPSRVSGSDRLGQAWHDMMRTLRILETQQIVHQPGSRIVNLLMNYSGSGALARMLQAGDTPGSTLDNELGGPIGLVMRTGGEMRHSDGPCHLMYESHAEIMNKLFPEVDDSDFRMVLSKYFPARLHARR